MNQREPGEPSYSELATRLYQDGERFVRTRAMLYRALVRYRAMQMRLPGLLILIAVALTSAAMMAILLGFVLALAQQIGGVLAGLVIGTAGLAISAVLVFVAWKLLPDLDENPFGDNEPVVDPILEKQDEQALQEAGE